MTLPRPGKAGSISGGIIGTAEADLMARADRNGDASGRARSDKAKARREAKARARWEREAERRVRLCYAIERNGEGHGLLLPEVRVLQAISVGEQTWTPTAELARVGLNGTTLAGLMAVGWVEDFSTEAGEMLTFSPWAAEALGIEPQERWEVFSGVAEQEDSSGERTRMTVREPNEIARWNLRPQPPEPGMPRPKPQPIKLPFLYRLSKLPEDVIEGMIARTIIDPVEEAIENEECQRAMEKERRFLERQARTETGQLDVDPESGQIRMEPVVLFPTHADDGLKGGVADSHGGKIPLDPRMSTGRKPGKKKKRRRRSA
jgi:hypothetical protein